MKTLRPEKCKATFNDRSRTNHAIPDTNPFPRSKAFNPVHENNIGHIVRWPRSLKQTTSSSYTQHILPPWPIACGTNRASSLSPTIHTLTTTPQHWQRVNPCKPHSTNLDTQRKSGDGGEEPSLAPPSEICPPLADAGWEKRRRDDRQWCSPARWLVGSSSSFNT